MIKNKLFIAALLAIFLVSCSIPNKSEPIDHAKDLTQGEWFFKQYDKTDWMPATVPGTVHTDLMAIDSIDDSFYRLNEKKQQWIDKVDWEYKTQFTIDKEMMDAEGLDLKFLGLDTYADIYLNDELVLQTENMFRTYILDIKDKVKPETNDLRIVFNSPINKGLKLIDENGYQLPANNDQSENGGVGENVISPFVRKAPYHFGWDWGPRLVTCGVWKPILLTAWNKAKINDLHIEQNLISEQNADIVVNTEIEAIAPIDVTYKIIDLTHNVLLSEGKQALEKGNNTLANKISIQNPDLWWPNGYGKQNLYNIKIEFSDKKSVIAEKQVKTGLRSIKLIREKDAEGTSFYFNVNDKAIFAKGANYIPNDNFVTRVSTDKYKHVLQSAVDANMNMLRIWGGGIYEYDVFYDLCDSLGIMVWQDFMFACSMFPGNDAFLENVKHEAIDNVKRLRNHPSIALWCGNNEIEAAWPEAKDNPGWGWKKRYTPEQQNEIWHSYDTIFYSILPEVVKQYNHTIAYWPSSPLTDFKTPASHENTSGDMHYWGVWHGLEKFDRFNQVIPRFMSEFGFQSFPDFQSVKKYTNSDDWNIESEVMASHQRSGIGNLRIKEYMSWDYHVPSNFEQFLYVGQVLQAEGMRIGMEAHRRNKPYCMGTLYWQLNDCWPVASWSGMDYYGKWKALHYFTKKAFAPYLISIVEMDNNIEVWTISDKFKNTDAILKLSLIDFKGNVLFEEEKNISIKENASLLAKKLATSSLLKKGDKANMVLKAELISNGEKLASNCYYFEKTKDLKLENAKPVIIKTNEGISITSTRLIKNLYLYTENNTEFSDNYFDVIPGMKYTINITNEKVDINDIKYISIIDTY